MSDPFGGAERWDMICDSIEEFVVEKLVQIFREQWSDGFHYKSDPDLVGRLCMLKDLANRFELEWELLFRIHSGGKTNAV